MFVNDLFNLLCVYLWNNMFLFPNFLLNLYLCLLHLVFVVSLISSFNVANPRKDWSHGSGASMQPMASIVACILAPGQSITSKNKALG